MGSDGPVGLHV